MPEKVLLAGNNVRNVAESARKAGYEVYAVTKFADADLRIYAEVFEVEDGVEELRVAEIVQKIADEVNAPVVLCSGFEDLKINAELLCNKPDERVVDKLRFYRELERAGLPFPELLGKDEVGIVKPRKGGGGEDVAISSSSEEGFVKQRYIKGVPCSVSLIAHEGNAVPVACNLIFAGWREMNADGFRYSGNLTPLTVDRELRVQLEKLAVETVELFGLSGSVGVDFILASEHGEHRPYILEVNPRFQGSLDSVEWSCDVNIFRMHVDALRGKLPERVKPKRYAVRAVLFTPRKMEIKVSPAGNPFFADVPKRGDVYNKDDPLVSILAADNNPERVKKKILERRDMFLAMQQA